MAEPTACRHSLQRPDYNFLSFGNRKKSHGIDKERTVCECGKTVTSGFKNCMTSLDVYNGAALWSRRSYLIPDTDKGFVYNNFLSFFSLISQ